MPPAEPQFASQSPSRGPLAPPADTANFNLYNESHNAHAWHNTQAKADVKLNKIYIRIGCVLNFLKIETQNMAQCRSRQEQRTSSSSRVCGEKCSCCHLLNQASNPISVFYFSLGQFK
jgi:uncharacterized protein (DUF3084 family)